jgi:hypothetical protein
MMDEPKLDPAAPAPGGPSAEAAKPVAVVWCRQVDNEAESPGYTTVPAEFPGRAEALEAVRAVGHLTVNVADTADYWDPDPGQTLAYYPNLFLYPAFGGQYTCVGRMFLSKEDRPRLGMKTLVLPTPELLQGEGFGATVLRWHGSMTGMRRPASRAGIAIEPRLYDLVAEGFLFHLGSTNPVLLIGAARWERAMHVILDMIREMPSSLVALTTVLAFPYFLPSSGSELREFQRKVPVSLALMRVPALEVGGERHEKRVRGWEASATTVWDIAGETLPGDTPKGAVASPLVVRYVRDRDAERLAMLRSRVDLVELPGLKARLVDPEFRDGRKRRKEAWRIGTAMENAALLMARPKGRPPAAGSESVKRAREYVDAGARQPPAPSTSSGKWTLSQAAFHPADTSETPAPDGGPKGELPERRPPETVPVPTRLDPLPGPLHVGSPPSRLAWLASPGTGEWAVLDEAAVRRVVAQELDRRGGAGPSGMAEEVARSIALGVASAREQLEAQFHSRLERVEERLQRMGGGAPEPAGGGTPLDHALAGLEERLRGTLEENRSTTEAEVDRRLEEFARQEGEERGSLETQLTEAAQGQLRELREWAQHLSDERHAQLEALVRSEVEKLQAASAVQEEAARAEEVTMIEARIQPHVDRKVQELLEAERTRLDELIHRIQELVDARPPAPPVPAEAGAPKAEGEAAAELRASFEDLRSEQAEILQRLQDLDHRTQVLSDRLVPLVREALTRLGQGPRAAASTTAADVALVELRRELQAETQRIESQMLGRIDDLRRHMETAMGHQSRVWLTLVQHLSELTDERARPARAVRKEPGTDAWTEPAPAEPSSPPPESPGEATPEPKDAPPSEPGPREP